MIDASIVAGFISTAALQGTMLIAGAWAADQLLCDSRPGWRELLWRVALFGGVVIATLQFAVAPAFSIHRFVVASTKSEAPAQSAADNNVALSTHNAPALSPRLTIAEMPQRFAPHVNSTPIDWPRWIVAVWLLGAVASLLRTGMKIRTLRRTLRPARPLSDIALDVDSTAISQRIGISPPLLLQLDDIPSPIAAHGARIVIPDWALQTLEREQLRVMLAHEIAHIARRDPEWKIIIALWCSVFWFIPLAWIARRRLDDLAEIACDAVAAHHTQNHRGLAECLIACAEHRVTQFSSDLVPAMAARRSSIVHRIDRLLEGVPMETRLSPAHRLAAVISIVFCATALPAVGFDRTAHAVVVIDSASTGPASSSVSIHSDNDSDSMRISFNDGLVKTTARVDGKITFNADDTDITGLASGGKASFEETRDGTTRRAVFVEHAGTVTPTYFVADTEQPFDANAHAWFSALLPKLIRETGIGAQARVKRLYDQGGTAHVLDEIGKTHSSYARGLYLQEFLLIAKLTPNDLDKVLAAAGAIESDYERRKALTQILDTQTLAPEQQTNFLKQADRLASDYERAELLVAALPKLTRTDATYQAWLAAANRIGSDYEHRRCLQALLERGETNDADLTRVLDASNSLQSDYEHRELLVATIDRAHDLNAIAPAYTQAAKKLGSAFEHREALMALIRRGSLNASSSRVVLDATTSIDSDFDRKEVLIALARVMPKDESLVARYHEVTSHLSSFERDEADRALR
jgi:beta-lactamase regulating signal transducer with metallopeptidase domain